MKGPFARRTTISLLIAAALLFAGLVYPQSMRWPEQAIEWLIDTSGPEIEAELPTGYTHGLLPVHIALTDLSGVEIRSLAVDGRPISPGQSAKIDTGQLPDGKHILTVEAEDRSLRKNGSKQSFSFQTDNTPPKLALQSDPLQVGQGRTLVIRVDPSELVTLTGWLDGRSLSFLQTENRYWAIAGFDPDSKVGPRDLEVLAVDKAGMETKARLAIPVVRIDYPTESLYIPEDRSNLLNPATVENEIAYLSKVFAVSTAEKLWAGPYLMPAQAVTSSPFAIRRSYNGGPLGSHHGGMDIAAAEGTPVAAANRGRVVVAEPLKVRGNVVILDHGLGVYSAYYHLSAIKAEKDQVVEKGQIIGLVGNTGLSTGAHLHWEMRVGGAAVEPLEWTARSIP